MGGGVGGLGSWELGAGKLGAGELGSSEMWSWKLVSWGAGELGPTLTHSSGVPPRATPDEPPPAAAMLDDIEIPGMASLVVRNAVLYSGV